MFCPTCESEIRTASIVSRRQHRAGWSFDSENTVHDTSEAKFVPLHHLGSPRKRKW